MTDIEKAIEQLDMFIDCKKYYEQGYNVRQPPELLFLALELALQTLKEKAERDKPKPLTLDELRKRVGKPVWHNERKNWVLVIYVEDDYVRVVDGYAQCYCYCLTLNTFYDHEPKEGAANVE